MEVIKEVISQSNSQGGSSSSDIPDDDVSLLARTTEEAVLSSCASLLGVDDIICRTELFNMSLMVGLCSQDLLRQLSSN